VGPLKKEEKSVKVAENLNTLVNLQEIDSQIINLRQKLDTYPLEIKKIDKLIEEIEKKFENEKNKLTNLEKKRKDKEREIADINEKIKKLKEKTSQIKTNKEYQALLKEIETFEENVKKEEENLLLILYDYDETKKLLEESKKDFDEEKKKIELKKKEIEREIQLTHERIDQLKENRKKLVNLLPKEMYNEYMELMKKHKGLAVAEVKNSVCQGCFLHIPPQLYVEIKLNQQLHYCPQCGRILFYRKEELKEEQVQAE